jgi:hypothetical protein
MSSNREPTPRTKQWRKYRQHDDNPALDNPEHNHPVTKVISGGQVGADIAGLRAAKRVGIETGGWMPRTFRTKQGPRPEYADLYNVKELTTRDYRARTRLNVEDSDATFRMMLDPETAGEVATLWELKYAGKPYIDFFFDYNYKLLDPDGAEHKARRWLKINNIKTLNVAGNAYIYLEPPVEEFLVRVLGHAKTYD